VKVDEVLVSKLTHRADLVSTLQKLDRLLEKTYRIYTESQQLDDQVDPSTISIQENVMDVGGESPFFLSAGLTKGPFQGQKEVLRIEKFLERPIEIDTAEIKVGDELSAEYKVWDIISTDPSIRSKFRNFAYFRGDVHLRFAISGTPFHAGKILFSYQPYPVRNKTLQTLLANVALDPTLRPLLLSYLSQAPGAVILDVKENRPCEMTCPFISTKSVHRLFNSQTTAISGATPFVDFEQAGYLYVYSMNVLRAVTESPTPIAFQIYGWFSNVELGTTTATNIEIMTESRDERKTGPIERMSTSMATVTQALTTVPFMSELAKASTLVLNGIAAVSAWFGWSKPALLEKPQFMKNRPYCNSCVTIGQETVEKLTWDPLQELTIDPRVVGMDKDEMSIAHLCAIESYLTTFEWDPDDAPMTNPIWLCKVNPCLTNYVVVGADHYQLPMPMSFATAPFFWWRGKIKFRIEIVCSQFDRGKLLIFFEPNINHATLINLDIATNKNFVKIIDIQETQSVEFCVNWAQPRAWNKIIHANRNPYSYGPALDFALDTNGFSNGYIGIVPFTELQSPVSEALKINVYVCAQDVQVNVLTDENIPIVRKIVTESADITHTTMDGEVTCFDLNESTASPYGTCDYFFGEQPLSLRSALKRYVTNDHSLTDTDAGATAFATASSYVYVKPDPKYDGVTRTGLSSLLDYLPYAFLGMRGGMRKRVRFYGGRSDNSAFTNRSIVVSNSTIRNPPTVGLVLSNSGPARLNMRGSVAFIPHVNGGIEFEIPFYSNNLFAFSCADDWIGTNGTDDMDTVWEKTYTVDADFHTDAATLATFVEDSATAEDFTFMHFLGSPYYTSAV